MNNVATNKRCVCVCMFVVFLLQKRNSFGIMNYLNVNSTKRLWSVIINTTDLFRNL